MSEHHTFPVPDAWAEKAWADNDKYQAMYKQSIDDPEAFWGEQGKRIDWIKPYSKVKETDFTGNVDISWYSDGTLNASANCLDRHLATRGDQTAIIWEGDDPNEAKTITYAELHKEVCQFANGLKSIGAKKGDRITLYMPMIPEALVAMLACARIGAVHSVVFGGFAANELAKELGPGKNVVVVLPDTGERYFSFNKYF